MQEEVNQKTVTLSIRTTKLTGKVLAAALGKVARALQKHHRKALTPQGRQSVKKLMNHYGGKSVMPYVKKYSPGSMVIGEAPLMNDLETVTNVDLRK